MIVIRFDVQKYVNFPLLEANSWLLIVSFSTYSMKNKIWILNNLIIYNYYKPSFPSLSIDARLVQS